MNLSFFEQKFNSPVVSNTVPSDKLDESVFVYDNPEKSEVSDAMPKMNEAVEMFHKSICSMNLSESQMNSVYDNVQKLFQNTSEFFVAAIQQNLSYKETLGSISHILELASDMVCTEISKKASSYKRHKQIAKNNLFVEPKELAIGLRWERVKKSVESKLMLD